MTSYFSFEERQDRGGMANGRGEGLLGVKARER